MKKTIIYRNYQEYLSATESFLASLRIDLNSDFGVIIINDFPVEEDNTSLEDFCNKLGKPHYEMRNIDHGIVYLVEHNENLAIPTYANNNKEFPAHTDCADYLSPPDTVLLLCEKNSEQGGDSFLVLVDDLIKRCSPKTITELEKKQFLQGKAFLPIIEKKANFYQVRYNRIMLDLYLESNNLTLSNEAAEALEEWENLINEQLFVFKLRPGECLLFNNQRFLHGRKAFEGNSQRRLKRVRISINS